MRVHRDIEKTSIGLDWTGLWKPGSDRSSCIVYIYPHINSRGQHEDYKLTLIFDQYEHSIL